MNDRKRFCLYVDETMHTPNGYVPVAVTEGEAGFSPMTGNGAFAQPWYWGHDIEKAKAIAADSNAKMGLSEKDVSDILASSIGTQVREDAAQQRAADRYEALHKGKLDIVERNQEKEGPHP